MFKTLFATSALLGYVQAVKLTEPTTLPSFTPTPLLADIHDAEVAGADEALNLLLDDGISVEEKKAKVHEFLQALKAKIPEDHMEKAKEVFEVLEENKEVIVNWVKNLKNNVESGDKAALEQHFNEAKEAAMNELGIDQDKINEIKDCEAFKAVQNWIEAFVKKAFKLQMKQKKQVQKLAQIQFSEEKMEKIKKLFMQICQTNQGLSQQVCQEVGEDLLNDIKGRYEAMPEENKKAIHEDPKSFVKDFIGAWAGGKKEETDGGEKGPCPIKQLLDETCAKVSKELQMPDLTTKDCVKMGKKAFMENTEKAIEFLKEVIGIPEKDIQKIKNAIDAKHQEFKDAKADKTVEE